MSKSFQSEPRYPFSRKCHAVLMFCVLLVLSLISCTPEPVRQPTAGDQGFSQSYVQDVLILSLHTSKKEITVAGQLELVLEAAVPENVEVQFPVYSASLGDFTLKDSRLDPPRMTGSGDNVRVVHRVTYLLEPYLSGTYSIPAMTVTYRDKNSDMEGKTLATEEIQVSVQSLLEPDTAAVEIKDIRPPLSLPPNRVQQFLVIGLIFLLAALGAAGLLYRKKTAAGKLPAAVQLRPEEIALQELEKLLAENLLARGEIELFHLRISDILRHYIEDRFGLQAPERTTEEFLSELSLAKSSASTLLGSHKTLLADFLAQCDLVKFARHEPTMAESEETVVICREFIEKTKEEAEG
ncbi:MAG: hypothetical protein AMJ60_04355 [Desulfobacterales bacterium SG8_35]|nr:MAG: hypothetical protein AMJ60_04355 [Desulfobacterales bacterium SG8_35]